jgi:hypothetical protein
VNSVIVLLALVPGQSQYKPPEFKIDQSSFQYRVRLRDALVERVGPEILPLTKTYGDVAIYALTKCQPETARALCRMEFSSVKQPVAVLEAIKKHGEPVARWVARNFDTLADQDHLEAFTRNPLDFVYDMADLDERATAVKTSRQPLAALLQQLPEGSAPWIVIAVVVIALVIVWKRKSASEIKG